MAVSPCSGCGSKSLFRTKKPISSGGGYSPDILPGLSPWHKSARVDVVVCENCGLVRTFASRDALRRLATSPKWERV